MPELPEVETTKVSLTPLLSQNLSAVQVFQPKLRWPIPDDLESLIGYKLQKVERRAKYLILTFAPVSETLLNSLPEPISVAVDNHQTVINNDALAVRQQRQLIMHLGMSGSLQQHAFGTDKRKHDHLIMVFTDDNGAQAQLHYHDPRRFGAVLWYEDYSSKLLEHLGPEPLSSEFTAEYLYHLIQRTNNTPETHETMNKKTKKRPITRAIK